MSKLINKEEKKRLINKMLVVTGSINQDELKQVTGVSSFHAHKSKEKFDKVVNIAMLNYCLKFVNIWEMVRMVKSISSMEKIKQQNIAYRGQIKSIKMEIEELKSKKVL